MKTYGIGPYSNAIKNTEDDIKKHQEKVKELIGIKESDTGLSLPSQWDLVSDKQRQWKGKNFPVIFLLIETVPSHYKFTLNCDPIVLHIPFQH